MDKLNTAQTFAATNGGRYYRPDTLPPASEIAPKPYVALLSEYQRACGSLTEKRNAHTKIDRDLQVAEDTFLDKAAEAQVKGKKYADPRPALRTALEAATVDVMVAETVVVGLSDRIYAHRTDPAMQAAWKSAADSRRATLLDLADRQLADLERTLSEVADADFAVLWGTNRNAKHNIVGSAELGRLGKLLSVRRDPRPMRYVRPAAMSALQRGETVEDTAGNTLTPAEADALLKARKLRVSHGPLQRVGRPDFD